MLCKKCKLSTKSLRPCSTLSRAISDKNVGITSKIIFSMSKRVAIREIIVLHSGEWKKQGIVLNFCPFCGQSIYKSD